MYIIADSLFFIDMILTFFTTYTDDLTLIEVYDKKKIAIHYL
jgi:hypothetical protein